MLRALLTKVMAKTLTISNLSPREALMLSLTRGLCLLALIEVLVVILMVL